MNLDVLLQDHRLYHSELQQDYFITKRSGGTIYGQYKQALRELYKRFRGLKGLYYERDLMKIDIEELMWKIEDREFIRSVFDEKRNKLELEKKKLDLIELSKNIEDTEREFKRFYQQAFSLKKVIGELTEEKRNELDKEMWIYKLKEMCCVDFISNGRVKNTTLELINCLDLVDRKPILEIIKNKEQLFEWFDNKEENYKLIECEIDLSKLLDKGANDNDN